MEKKAVRVSCQLRDQHVVYVRLLCECKHNVCYVYVADAVFFFFNKQINKKGLECLKTKWLS